MNRYTFRMLIRSIRASFGRFLAIFAIVALGVGFFAGLKSSCPAMLASAERYWNDQLFSDFTLMSSLGLTREDEDAFRNAWDDLVGAEGGFFADAWLSLDGEQEVYHLMSLPERVDLPSLTAGRLPEKPGECLGDSRCFDEADLGKTLRLSGENEEDTLELLPGGAYTLVGLARSPRYMSDYRGDTSLGSGRIAGFVYLLPADFDSEVLHEIRLRFDFPGALYSEEYEAARDRRETAVKALLNRRGELRRQKLRAEADEELLDARQEIDDGWQEYRDAKQEAEDEFREAEDKLDLTRRQLDDGEREIVEGRRELEAGMAQAAAARTELETQRGVLDATAAQLQAGREAIAAGRAQLDAAEAEIRAGEEQLAAAKAAALAPLQQMAAEAAAQLAALQAAADASGDPEAYADAIAEAEAALTALQDALTEAGDAFAPQEAEIAAALGEIAAGREALQAQENEIAAGEAALQAGYAQLDAAAAELDAAEASFPDLLWELGVASGQILNGRYELEQAREEYEEEKAKAEKELSDAEQELLDAEAEYADAVRDAEEALRLDLYTLDRDANPGYVSFESDVRIIDGLADVFPVFFVLVAALICVTTMTRMVGEERTLIGTMKAMGYADAVTSSKYLLYAGTAALTGCVAGFFLGTVLIPRAVAFAYRIMYDYAELDFYFSPLLYLLSTVTAVVSTVLVTWLACRRELREKPAELVRPKAPKSGKRILLERLPLWKRLPFLSKVSLRNAFRYPLRLMMMLLGIGGCTALMVAGFGARDSVARIADLQYGRIFLYDMAVNLDTEDLDSDEAAALLWRGEASLWAMTRQESVTLSFGGRSKSTRTIAADSGALDGLICLIDADGRDIPFPGPDEAVVTEKIAELLKLRAGDVLNLETDEGLSLKLRVSGICKNYLKHYIFLRSDTLGGRHNTALLTAAEGTDPARLAARLRGEEGVSYVTLSEQERAVMAQSMQSLDLLVLLLIVCSAALAVITLYNLTNINILERSREIATVQVLGFTPAETGEYVLRENILLALMGAVLGLGLGKLLHYVVIHSLVVDNMSCDIRITALSYLMSFAFTMVFTLLTNLLMRGRLEKINMAESLKSVE